AFPAKESLATNSFVEEVSFSGAFSEKIEGSGVLRVGLKDPESDFSFNPSETLSAAFHSADSTYEETAPAQPETSNIQLSGAYAGSLNVNTVIQTVNSNLKRETNDLVLSDHGGGDSYTTAVVLFFPGAA